MSDSRDTANAALIMKVATDPHLDEKDKAIIINRLDCLHEKLESDRRLHRMVAVLLGSVALLTIIGAFCFTMYYREQNIPDGLVALGSASIGGLTGLLAPSRTNHSR